MWPGPRITAIWWRWVGLPDGTHSGVWSIDTNNGTNSVLVPATFVRTLNVSPDGTRMSYLVTFSGDSSKDGIWVANVDGSHATHLTQVGAIRWAGDDNHLWLLDLAAAGAGEDHVRQLDVRYRLSRVRTSRSAGGC